MTNAQVIQGSRDANAAALILKAGKAAASMLQLCKDAAGIAAQQLNPATPIKQRIADVVALYNADFTAAGHNVRALFVDALTLKAAAQTPVTVSAIVDGKKTDVHVTAGEAAQMPKHAMRDAAKQVREAIGTARKPAAKKAAAPKAPAAPDMMVKTEVDGFSQWLDNLEPYFTDVIFHQKIVARMIEMGYTVSKAAPGRKVTGKASA
jgi:hypothetical protein